MVLHRPVSPNSEPEWPDVKQRVQDEHHTRRAKSGIPRAKPELVAPLPSFPQLLTVPEVAKILRLSPRTVWRLIRDERLPAVRIGRSVRVHPDAVAALIKQPLGDDREDK